MSALISYNLIDKAWIPIIEDSSNAINYVSLREIFLRAHLINDIYHQLAPEELSLRKFLLAVALCIMKEDEQTSYNTDVERWDELWELGFFPESKVNAYFDKWYDRFDLFSDQYPLYQVKEDKTEIYMSNLFRNYSGTYINQFLSHDTYKSVCTEKISELAIRILSYQAYYIGAGSGNISSINTQGMHFWIRANNLFEAILLNSPADDTIPNSNYKPAWEYNKYFEEAQGRIPTSFVDYLTIMPRKLFIKIPNKNVITTDESSLNFFPSKEYVQIYGKPGRTTQIENEDGKGKKLVFNDPMMPFKNDTYQKYRFDKPFWLNMADYYLSRKNNSGACPLALALASANYNKYKYREYNIYYYDFATESTTKITKTYRGIFPYYPVLFDDQDKIASIQNLIKTSTDIRSKVLWAAVKVFYQILLSPNKPNPNDVELDNKIIETSPVFHKYWNRLETEFNSYLGLISKISDNTELSKIEDDWAKAALKIAKYEFSNLYGYDEKYKAFTIAMKKFNQNTKGKSK